MRVLVVCGLSETMASLWPTIRLRSVDLPAFGRPRNETKPDLNLPFILYGCRLLAAEADLGYASSFDFEHLHVQKIDFEALADVRHSPQMRQEVTADGFETLALDFHAKPIDLLVNADLAA